MKMGDIEFELGRFWKPPGTYGVIVPIIRKTSKRRYYMVIEEVKDKLELKDTGTINNIEIISTCSEPVFIRSGSIFEGKGTQSRGLQCSVIVMPNATGIAPVRCVHASHSISTGRGFSHIGIAPMQVAYKLMKSSSQAEVWHSVERLLPPVTGPRTDNLAEKMKQIDEFKKDMDKNILDGMPHHRNQIGVCVIDTEGIVGIEVFDHPASWKAIRDDIIKRYGSGLRKSDKERQGS